MMIVSLFGAIWIGDVLIRTANTMSTSFQSKVHRYKFSFALIVSVFCVFCCRCHIVTQCRQCRTTITTDYSIRMLESEMQSILYKFVWLRSAPHSCKKSEYVVREPHDATRNSRNATCGRGNFSSQRSCAQRWTAHDDLPTTLVFQRKIIRKK